MIIERHADTNKQILHSLLLISSHIHQLFTRTWSRNSNVTTYNDRWRLYSHFTRLLDIWGNVRTCTWPRPVQQQCWYQYLQYHACCGDMPIRHHSRPMPSVVIIKQSSVLWVGTSNSEQMPNYMWMKSVIIYTRVQSLWHFDSQHQPSKEIWQKVHIPPMIIICTYV